MLAMVINNIESFLSRNCIFLRIREEILNLLVMGNVFNSLFLSKSYHMRESS